MYREDKQKTPDWGFGINKDRQIDFDRNDRRLAEYIRKYVPSYNLCISCGACTATCSTANLTDFYNIRRLNIFLMRGEIDEIAKHIDKCMFCGKCELVCPRGVNTRQVILIMKEGIKKIRQNEQL